MHLDAEEWFMNENHSYLFSFENVCEALGYDPQYMRQGLLRWKESVVGNRGKREAGNSQTG